MFHITAVLQTLSLATKFTLSGFQRSLGRELKRYTTSVIKPLLSNSNLETIGPFLWSRHELILQKCTKAVYDVTVPRDTRHFYRKIKGKGKGRLWVLQHCCLEAYCTFTRRSSFIYLPRRCTHQAAWETSASEGRNYIWNLTNNP